MIATAQGFGVEGSGRVLRGWAAAIAALLVLVFGATAASAQPDEDTFPGDAYIKIDKQYAKVRVNGEEYEDHEFVANGYTLVLHKLDRTQRYEVTLEAIEGGFEPATVVLEPEKSTYKRTKKGKGKERYLAFEAHRSVKFKKASADKPAGGDAPAGDAEAPAAGGGE